MSRSGGPARGRGRARDIVVAFAAIMLLALLAARLQAPAAPDIAGRARAADGDSLDLSGRRVRLAGIDAPELDQTCLKGDAEIACGRAARTALARLVADIAATCAVLGRDRYGRDLGQCRAGATDVNAAMVRAGHAVAFGSYEAEERLAQAERAGIWATEFVRPADWRRQQGGIEEPVHAGLTGFRAMLRRLVGV